LYVSEGNDGISQVLPSGKVNQWALPADESSVNGITSGPDGKIWYTTASTTVGSTYGVGEINYVTTSGTFGTPIIVPSGSPFNITEASDGTLWFTENFESKIGRVNSDGSVSLFSLGGIQPWGIVQGPDGKIWFSENGYIGKIEPSTGSVLDQFATGVFALNIINGPGNTLWFNYTGSDGGIGQVNFTTGINLYSTGGFTYDLTLGSDGNIWFTNVYVNKMNPTTPSSVTSYPIPFSTDAESGIAAGSDGNIWFIGLNYTINRLTSSNSLPILAPLNTANGNQFTDDPVRYADGTVDLSFTDLSSAGIGPVWGQTRGWTNGGGYSAGSENGNGWVDSQDPSLVQIPGTSTLAVVVDGTDAYFFNQQVDGSYVEQFDGTYQLTYDESANTYTLTDASGDATVFDGFTSSHPGQFLSMSNPGGATVSVTSWTSSGQMQEVRASAGETIDSYKYAYVDSGVNEGLLSSVTLRQSTDGGTDWQYLQSIQYTYYDGTDYASCGNAGDLMTATIEDPSGTYLAPVWTSISTDYYRYYTDPTAAGADPFGDGLEYVVENTGYAELKASEGSDAAVYSASNSVIAPYANYYYTYDSYGRIATQTASGFGDSTATTNTGQGAFSFSYTVSSNPDGPNSWHMKTVETLPDGNSNTVYTNVYGDVMLTVYDAGASQQTATYYKYDDQEHCILMANPSAVTGYDESYADLVNWEDGTAEYLNDNSGLITTYVYYSSTTATSTVAGGVANYEWSTAIQDGQLGSLVPQELWTYTSNSAGTVYNVATDTVYRNDGSGDETISYTYTYFSGTSQIQKEITEYPVVLTGQNGSNSATTTTDVYDQQGQLIWSMDQSGVINYTAYDPQTGAVIKQVNDVNTGDITDPAELSTLPSGWTTPSGDGQSQTTQYVVDSLGRTVEQIDPDGNITWTVYDDADNEIITFAGWNPTTATATAPVEVYVENLTLGYTESFTISGSSSAIEYSGSSGSYYPTGLGSISSVLSLTRDILNNAGQKIEEDDYFNLSGITYSASSVYLGAAYSSSSGTGNYYTTYYSYNAAGLQDRTVDPSGTITDNVYDGQGRLVSTWVGTDDTPTSAWSPTNLPGGNMVETASYIYDNGAPGDGNLTQKTLYTGESSSDPDQVTQWLYDWRDRQIAEKDGVQSSSSEQDGTNRPITVWKYDNLNEVIETQTFDGDGILLTPQTVAVLTLIASEPSANISAIGSGGEFAQIAEDSAGNFFVTGGATSGETIGSGDGAVILGDVPDNSYYVAKYAPDGSLDWVRLAAVEITGIATDSNGNLDIVGENYWSSLSVSDNNLVGSGGGTENPSAVVWKVSGTGVSDWFVQSTESDGNWASASAVAVDSSGNVYVTGALSGGGTTLSTVSLTGNNFVWKLSSSGTTTWAVVPEGSGSACQPSAIAVNSAGEAYVTGTDSGTDFPFLWKLTSSGGLDWADYPEAIGAATGVAVDAAGDAYVGGAGMGYDLFVWKVSSSGTTDWIVAGEALEEYGFDDAPVITGIAVDPAGDVYVVGGTPVEMSFGGVDVTPPDGTTAFVWKLNSAGETESVLEPGAYAGPNVAIAIDPAGDIAVSSNMWGSYPYTFGNTTLTGPGYDGALSTFVWHAADELRSQTDYSYDNLGQLYQTQSFSVDPNTGEIGNSLASETYYNANGNVIEQTQLGGLVMKYTYNGLGEVTAAYTTDGGGGTSYAAASSVANDVVLSQTESDYDADGNVTETITSNRLSSDTGSMTGALNDGSNGGVAAQIDYNGNYYDPAGRLTASVDMGDNGGTAWSNDGTAPTPSSTALVTSYDYDSAGNQEDVIDPKGIDTRTYYNALGQPTQVIEDDGGSGHLNDTTDYAYGPAGKTSMTSVQTDGEPNQTTHWDYGVTTPTSAINSNDIVSDVEYPNPSTGDPASSLEDTYTVDAQGKVQTYTDRNGTIHSYSYDSLGREIADTVTSLGSESVDGAVMKITVDYDGQGNPYLITSYDGSGIIVNQVMNLYNGYGQLIQQYQSTSGPVSAGTTPSVQYTYTDGADGNNSRLTSMVYPDGYTVDYNYSSGLNDAVSRISSVSDSLSDTPLETYSFQGVSTVAALTMPQAGLTEVTLFDHFDRVQSMTWSTSSATLSQYTYAYDADSNVVSKTDGVNSDLSQTYSYDNVNEVIGYAEGTASQSLQYDALGNLVSNSIAVFSHNDIANETVTALGARNDGAIQAIKDLPIL